MAGFYESAWNWIYGSGSARVSQAAAAREHPVKTGGSGVLEGTSSGMQFEALPR